MVLVVLGANGLLGSNVVATAVERGHDVAGTYHATEPDFDIPLVQLDITESTTVRQFFEDTSPDGVVNCAAMTDVDACEKDSETAVAVNAAAPTTIAKICEADGVWFGHVSTDYVFDGLARGRYTETDPTNPIQAYGASKLAGERGVTDAMTAPLITRLSFVWGVHRSRNALTGFPRWVRDSLYEGDTAPLFTDQFISPTRAGQAASVLVDLFEGRASGTVNVACRSCVTPYEFGASIDERLENPSGALQESTLSAVDRPAERPANTCLAVNRIEQMRDQPQPTLNEDLDAVTSYI